jgi:hypothetical protein
MARASCNRRLFVDHGHPTDDDDNAKTKIGAAIE